MSSDTEERYGGVATSSRLAATKHRMAELSTPPFATVGVESSSRQGSLKTDTYNRPVRVSKYLERVIDIQRPHLEKLCADHAKTGSGSGSGTPASAIIQDEKAPPGVQKSQAQSNRSEINKQSENKQEEAERVKRHSCQVAVFVANYLEFLDEYADVAFPEERILRQTRVSNAFQRASGGHLTGLSSDESSVALELDDDSLLALSHALRPRDLDILPIVATYLSHLTDPDHLTDSDPGHQGGVVLTGNADIEFENEDLLRRLERRLQRYRYCPSALANRVGNLVFHSDATAGEEGSSHEKHATLQKLKSRGSLSVAPVDVPLGPSTSPGGKKRALRDSQVLAAEAEHRAKKQKTEAPERKTCGSGASVQALLEKHKDMHALKQKFDIEGVSHWLRGVEQNLVWGFYDHRNHLRDERRTSQAVWQSTAPKSALRVLADGLEAAEKLEEKDKQEHPPLCSSPEVHDIATPRSPPDGVPEYRSISTPRGRELGGPQSAAERENAVFASMQMLSGQMDGETAESNLHAREDRASEGKESSFATMPSVVANRVRFSCNFSTKRSMQKISSPDEATVRFALGSGAGSEKVDYLGPSFALLPSVVANRVTYEFISSSPQHRPTDSALRIASTREEAFPQKQFIDPDGGGFFQDGPYHLAGQLPRAPRGTAKADDFRLHGSYREKANAKLQRGLDLEMEHEEELLELAELMGLDVEELRGSYQVNRGEGFIHAPGEIENRGEQEYITRLRKSRNLLKNANTVAAEAGVSVEEVLREQDAVGQVEEEQMRAFSEKRSVQECVSDPAEAAQSFAELMARFPDVVLQLAALHSVVNSEADPRSLGLPQYRTGESQNFLSVPAEFSDDVRINVKKLRASLKELDQTDSVDRELAERMAKLRLSDDPGAAGEQLRDMKIRDELEDLSAETDVAISAVTQLMREGEQLVALGPEAGTGNRPGETHDDVADGSDSGGLHDEEEMGALLASSQKLGAQIKNDIDDDEDAQAFHALARQSEKISAEIKKKFAPMQRAFNLLRMIRVVQGAGSGKGVLVGGGGSGGKGGTKNIPASAAGAEAEAEREEVGVGATDEETAVSPESSGYVALRGGSERVSVSPTSVERESLREPLLQGEEAAAVKIQKTHRAAAVRRRSREKAEGDAAGVEIAVSPAQGDSTSAAAVGEDAAATKIQAAHRGNATRRSLQGSKTVATEGDTAVIEKDSTTGMTQDKAAVKIQAAHRGNATRRSLQGSKAAAAEEDPAVVEEESATGMTQDKAAVKIQAAHRGNATRRSLQGSKAAATEEDLAVVEEESATGMTQDKAAVKIQAAHRGNATRRSLQGSKAAATEEDLAVVEEESATGMTQDEAAVKIQAAHRGNATRRSLQGSKAAAAEEDPAVVEEESATGVTQDKAAVKIQAAHRGNATRRSLQGSKAVATEGDTAVIEEDSTTGMTQDKAAVKIQAAHRGNATRRSLQGSKAAAAEEDPAVVEEESATGMTQDKAAVKIQAAHRGNATRRSLQGSKAAATEEDLAVVEEESATGMTQDKAAIKIQAAHRGNATRRSLQGSKAAATEEDLAVVEEESATGMTQDEAAVKIQAAHRGNATRRSLQGSKAAAAEEDPAVVEEESATGVTQDKAAVKIQAAHRGNATRRSLQGSKAVATEGDTAVIEEDSTTGMTQDEAAVKIQAAHRGNATRRSLQGSKAAAAEEDPAVVEEDSATGMTQDKAAVKIQAAHRGNATRRSLHGPKTAAALEQQEEEVVDANATNPDAPVPSKGPPFAFYDSSSKGSSRFFAQSSSGSEGDEPEPLVSFFSRSSKSKSDTREEQETEDPFGLPTPLRQSRNSEEDVLALRLSPHNDGTGSSAWQNAAAESAHRFRFSRTQHPEASEKSDSRERKNSVPDSSAEGDSDSEPTLLQSHESKETLPPGSAAPVAAVPAPQAPAAASPRCEQEARFLCRPAAAQEQHRATAVPVPVLQQVPGSVRGASSTSRSSANCSRADKSVLRSTERRRSSNSNSPDGGGRLRPPVYMYYDEPAGSGSDPDSQVDSAASVSEEPQPILPRDSGVFPALSPTSASATPVNPSTQMTSDGAQISGSCLESVACAHLSEAEVGFPNAVPPTAARSHVTVPPDSPDPRVSSAPDSPVPSSTDHRHKEQASGSEQASPPPINLAVKNAKSMRPFVIGVCGATSSGKTTVCDILRDELKSFSRVAFLPSDSYYKDLGSHEKQLAANNDYDFDHPDALEWGDLLSDLRTLKFNPTNRSVQLPLYDFKTHTRVKEKAGESEHHMAGGQLIGPSDVVIVEGILIYAALPELREEMDLRVFIDCDSDVRLARRVERDMTERGRELKGILQQYLRFVRPSYANFVEPSKQFADVIIPNNGLKLESLRKNAAIKMILHHIKLQLAARNRMRKGVSGATVGMGAGVMGEMFVKNEGDGGAGDVVGTEEGGGERGAKSGGGWNGEGKADSMADRELGAHLRGKLADADVRCSGPEVGSEEYPPSSLL